MKNLLILSVVLLSCASPLAAATMTCVANSAVCAGTNSDGSAEVTVLSSVDVIVAQAPCQGISGQCTAISGADKTVSVGKGFCDNAADSSVAVEAAGNWACVRRWGLTGHGSDVCLVVTGTWTCFNYGVYQTPGGICGGTSVTLGTPDQPTYHCVIPVVSQDPPCVTVYVDDAPVEVVCQH